jgi:hypothetical protein
MAKSTTARRQPARTATPPLTDEQLLERLKEVRVQLASIREETAQLVIEVDELERSLDQDAS